MDLAWDDLRLFLAVARLGGLSAARAATGLSAATIGRRMSALERDLGEPLFVRRQTGYALTPAGRELLSHAEDVEAAVRGIARWREAAGGERVVRVSTGHWTADFLARNIGAIWRPGEGVRVEFVTASERLDIGRRAVDLGIRNARPTGAALAGRRTNTVAFALYGARDRPADAAAGPFVALASGGTEVPSTRWLIARHGDRVALRANTAHVARELIAAGAGPGVLPCFVGDSDDRLARMGGLIAELSNEQWLVSHHEERHRPEVRAAAGRIIALLRANAALFAGQRPL